MDIKKITANVGTNDLQESKRFYMNLFGMKVGMDLGFVVGLSAPENPGARINIIQKSDHVVPNMSLEVADIDAVYSKAKAMGLKIPYDIRNEPWGVRRFFVTDPDGTVINVMMHI